MQVTVNIAASMQMDLKARNRMRAMRERVKLIRVVFILLTKELQVWDRKAFLRGHRNQIRHYKQDTSSMKILRLADLLKRELTLIALQWQ